MGLSSIPQHTLVCVQPGAGERWEVVVEGRAKSAQFSDRDRAVSYAQIWAAVNRPSKVVVYSSTGRIQQELAFNATGRYGL